MPNETQNPDAIASGDFVPRDTVTLEDIAGTFRRHLGLIVAVGLVFGALGYFAHGQVTPYYTATASLVLDQTVSRMVETGEPTAEETALTDPEIIETEIKVMTSRSSLRRVVEALDQQPGTAIAETNESLFDWNWLISSVSAALPDRWREIVGFSDHELDNHPIERLLAKDVVPADTLSEQEITAELSYTIQNFRDSLVIEQSGESHVIDIHFTSDDPVYAAEAANHVAQYYILSRLENRRDHARSASDWLEERLRQLETAVADAERDAAEFAQANGLFRSGGETLSSRQVINLKDQLIANAAAQLEIKSKLSEVEQLRRDPTQFDALSVLVDSSLISELRSKEVDLLRRAAELAQVYGKRHPQILSINAEMTSVRDKVRAEIDQSIGGLRDNLSVLRSRETAIRNALGSLQQENREERALTSTLSEMERRAQAARHIYDVVLERYQDVEAELQIPTADARVISRALVPDIPSTPSKEIFAVFGFTLSSLFTSFVVLLADRVSYTVRSSGDIERRIGARVLGTFPRLASRACRRKPQLLIAKRPMSPASEAARSILQMIQSEQNEKSRVVFVGSALPNEGKTTISTVLSTSAARLGLRVLLVDMDLRRPGATKIFGFSRSVPGLIDVMVRKSEFASVVHHDRATNIDIIPAGTPLVDPAVILHKKAIDSFLDEARRRYDLIFLDSAPIFAVAESRTINRCVDRTILVARWRRSKLHAVGHAARLLATTGRQIDGCVLTDVNLRRYHLYSNDATAHFRMYKDYYS